MRPSKSILTALGALVIAAPISAHHSFMAEFDQRKPVTLAGSVTGVEWQNPHTFFYMDVKDESGKIVNWRLATGSPGALMRRGWTRETVKVGDHLSVQGYRAKDIPNVAAARSVTMPDGRTIFGGQTDDGGPTQ